MSKATITSEIGAGRYNVRLNFNKSRAVSRLSDIDGLLAGLVIELSDKQTAFNDAKADLSLSSTLLTNAITLADPAKITEAEGVYYKNAISAEKASSELNRVKTEKLALEKEKSFIENNLPGHGGDIIVTAWCGDYTEGLTGEVGLVDVKNEVGDYKIIQPGFNLSSTPESEYNAARDGAQTPAISMSSGSGAFRAIALHDGWELFKPLYRTGTITNINGDFCNLTLDNQKTRSLNIDANREIGGSLSNVQIDYMDCHGTAFNIGDQVLIAFIGQNASTPRVIGFVDNPVPCETHGALTTINGKNYLVRHHEASGTWAARINNNVTRSTADWFGKYVNGKPTDYIAYDGNRYDATHTTTWGDEIRRNGKVVATAPQKFQGAGIATYSGEDYYIIVSKNDPVNTHLSTADDFWKRPVSGGAWTLIGSVPHSIYGLAATYEHMYPTKDAYHWSFSGDGLKAIHHQRIIIADPSFDDVNGSWENSVPVDAGTNGNYKYYNHPNAAYGNRKAAIVEVAILSDLSGLTHSIEWTGGDRVATQTSTPASHPLHADGTPSDRHEYHVTWSSIYAVDYSDSVRVNLEISIDHYISEVQFTGFKPPGEPYVSGVYDRQETITFKHKIGAYEAISTHSDDNYTEQDSGVVNRTISGTSYALGSFDLRTRSMNLFKEVVSQSITGNSIFNGLIETTAVTSISEEGAFIRNGLELSVGARSHSESYTDSAIGGANAKAHGPLIFYSAQHFLQDDDFMEIMPQTRVGFGATAMTITGGIVDILVFESRNHVDNGGWFFSGGGANQSLSKLTGTSSTIQDLTESGDFGPFGLV